MNTHTHTHAQTKYCNPRAYACRGLIINTGTFYHRLPTGAVDLSPLPVLVNDTILLLYYIVYLHTI